MTIPQPFVRSFEAGRYLESFLVAAVAAVLVIRLFLRLTGYPQIGGSGLHIAHMLWGGILMLASIVILLSFLNRVAEQAAAVIGGIGFGTFIDEIGKFVTSDHNYFFRPAVAMIYVVFILLFLSIRALHRAETFSREEYLINALRKLEEVALRDLDEEERERALVYLEKSDARDPLVVMLKETLKAAGGSRPGARRGWLAQVKTLARRLYLSLTSFWWFSLLLTIFFVIQLVVKLLYVLILIFFVGLGWEQILSMRVVGRVAERMVNLSFIDWAEITSSVFSGICVFCGVALIRRSRLSALKWFERSILVSIFITQVFAFYNEQFSALFVLFFNIVVLAALRFMLEREHALP